MSILFTILKIIGIVLMAVLAIFFFLVLMLLFHPVYYKVAGWIEEDVRISGRFLWLFGILWIGYQVSEKSLTYCIRLIGIPIRRYPKKPKKENKAPKQDKTPKQDTPEECDTCQIQKEQESVVDKPLENKSLKEEKKPPSFEHAKNKANIPKRKAFGNNLIQRIKDMVQKVIGIGKRLRKEWKDEANKSAFSLIIKELLYLFKKVRPKDIRGEISFSTGDPALTGQVLGIISVFPWLYQYKLLLSPDFLSEELYVRGNVTVKGHLMLIHPCISLLRMLKDKNIKTLIQKIRN